MSYSTDPALYIYTSLTSGSSHIVTATSRLETILRANRIPFKALDIATDEKARMLWGRRAGKDEGGRVRKLPGLVQEGMVLGDLVEIEEWNEYGELKLHIKIVPVDGPGAVKNVVPPVTTKPAQVAMSNEVKPPSSQSLPAQIKKENEPPMSAVGGAADSLSLALRQAGHEAAQKAKDTMKAAKALTGFGLVEPNKKEIKNAVIVASPAPLLMIQATASMQNPVRGTWEPVAPTPIALKLDGLHRKDVMSLQSPISSAWRPVF